MPKSRLGHKHETWIELQHLSKDVVEFDPDPAAWVSPFGYMKASVLPTGGAEIVDGQQVASNITHLVNIRWMPRLDTAWRVVVLDGTDRRVLEIDSITDWRNQHRYLDLKCIERPEYDYTQITEESVWVWFNFDIHDWMNGDTAIWNP